MQHKITLKKLQNALQKAEKAGDEKRMQEVQTQIASETAKEEERQKAMEEEQTQNSAGSFIANFTEVFGAPPAAWRQKVEAILEWFNPAPKGAAAKSRSA